MEPADVAWGLAVAVVGGLLVAWFAAPRRVLSLEWFEVQLVSVHNVVANRVKVEIDGKPTSDVVLLVLEVSNTGNRPIEPGLFWRDLELDFGGRCQIHVAEYNPSIVTERMEKPVATGTTVRLQPFNLAQKEKFSLLCYLNGSPSGSPKVIQRMKDVRVITTSESFGRNFVSVAVAAFLSYIMVALTFFGVPVPLWLASIVALISGVLMFGGLLGLARLWLRRRRYLRGLTGR